jgi:hypothetical protein
MLGESKRRRKQRLTCHPEIGSRYEARTSRILSNGDQQLLDLLPSWPGVSSKFVPFSTPGAVIAKISSGVHLRSLQRSIRQTPKLPWRLEEQTGTAKTPKGLSAVR